MGSQGKATGFQQVIRWNVMCTSWLLQPNRSRLVQHATKRSKVVCISAPMTKLSCRESSLTSSTTAKVHAACTFPNDLSGFLSFSVSPAVELGDYAASWSHLAMELAALSVILIGQQVTAAHFYTGWVRTTVFWITCNNWHLAWFITMSNNMSMMLKTIHARNKHARHWYNEST